MGNIFPRQPRYEFFDMMHGRPNWSDANILDIGGNRGNLLEDLLDLKLISPQQYTSLDVDQMGLDFGESNNPDANWIKHNAFNHAYNTDGKDETPFPFEDETFDLVCGYSIYSHTTFKQMLFDLIECLRVCKPNGSIAFTVVDDSGIKYFTEKRAYDNPGKRSVTFEEIRKSKIPDYMYLVDHDLLVDEMYSNTSCDYLVSIYNIKWLSSYLNKLNIGHKMKFPPQYHVQRSVVINKNNVDNTIEDLQKFYNEADFLVDLI
jgi:SAM-dependent methyltransferase